MAAAAAASPWEEMVTGAPSRAERCHHCSKYVRATHRMASTGQMMCGTGTQRTVVCASCSTDNCPYTTVRFPYRESTVNDRIDDEVQQLTWWGRDKFFKFFATITMD